MKISTMEMIQELLKDRSKKFKSKNYVGNNVEVFFDNVTNHEILIKHEGTLSKPLTLSYGVGGKGGILDWLWEEVDTTDWSKVEVDTPILVSNDGEEWNRRYFSHYEEAIYAWGEGTTSWSSDNRTVPWKYAKLAK